MQTIPVTHLPSGLGALDVEEQRFLLLARDKVFKNVDARKLFMVRERASSTEPLLVVEEFAKNKG